MSVAVQKHRKISWLSVLLLTALSVIFVVPYLSRNVSVVVILGMMVLYLVSVVNPLLAMRSWQKNTVYAVLLFVFVEALYKILAISSATIDYYFATIKSLFLLCAMLPVYQHLDRKQKCFIAAVCIIAFMYSVVDNIILSFQYTPDRFATLSMRAEGEKTNAADTAFTTSVMMFSGIAVCWLFCAKRPWQRLTALAMAGMSLWFLFTAGQRGIIFVLTLVMLVLLLIHRGKGKRTRWFWSVTIVVALLLLMTTGLYKTILYGIVDLLGAERLRVRVDDIILLIESKSMDSVEGSMSRRLSLILRSLQTFVSSPISFFFGVGDHRSDTLLVGNHSQFIDMLARYGIIGSAVFAFAIFRICKAVLWMVDAGNGVQLQNQLKVLLFVFILRGLLGNVMIGSVGVQMFVLIPLLFSLTGKQEAVEDA